MPRRLPSRRRHGGFTLLESVIASLVFLIGLVGLLGTLVQARAATSQARRDMQASALAQDLVEQINLWAYDDARLAPSPSPCGDDPGDEAGALRTPTSGAYAAYVACMHGEANLTRGGAVWGGVPTPAFSNDGVPARFERYYIVREQTVRPGVWRKHVWVKVLYPEGSRVRVVQAETVKLSMGGL